MSLKYLGGVLALTLRLSSKCMSLEYLGGVLYDLKSMSLKYLGGVLALDVAFELLDLVGELLLSSSLLSLQVPEGPGALS